MLSKRIIPCLDVRDGVVVKGTQFKNHVVVGTIENLTKRYEQQGADEFVFYDIVASARRSGVNIDTVRQISTRLSIPFSVAGGITSVEQAQKILYAGADKISINSPALSNPQLITHIAEKFGSQCVTVGIDSKTEVLDDGSLRYVVYQYTGSEETSRSAARLTHEWVAEVCALGAGEIVLNCMDCDGTSGGYDLQQLRMMQECCSVPLVASGGAGTMDHFAQALTLCDATLAAGVFHRGEITIPALKQFLSDQGLPIRLATVVND